MNEQQVISSKRVGLGALASVMLSAENQAMVAQSRFRMLGGPVWKTRKLAEAQDVLALSQIAPWRMRVVQLDLTDALRAVIEMRVPVPCRAEAEGQVVIANHALLGLQYPEAALRMPQPGYSFVQILAPGKVWHPSVSFNPEGIQALCLGQLPVSVPCKELILLTYAALQMTTVQLDEFDSAGVMNIEAARYWQGATDRIPLSRTAFLREE